MSTNIANISPYLQTTRKFPIDSPPKLETELSKMNLDVATAVNLRSIGIYDVVTTITGNQLYNLTTPLTKRQSQRKVYTFSSIAAGATLVTAHGINLITQLACPITGSVVTAIPDFRNIPHVSATLITDQIQVIVDATNITIINGATAPNITSGFVILEFLQT